MALADEAFRRGIKGDKAALELFWTRWAVFSWSCRRDGRSGAPYFLAVLGKTLEECGRWIT